MQLKNRITGKLYDVVEGVLLSYDKAKAKDITGSFLELRGVEDGEQVLYIWPYFADQEYTIEGMETYEAERLGAPSEQSGENVQSEGEAESDSAESSVQSSES